MPPQNILSSALVRITAPTFLSASAWRRASWIASIITWSMAFTGLRFMAITATRPATV